VSDFAWLPSYGVEESSKPRLKTVQFGDGYKQASPDGINAIDVTYRVVFRVTPAVADAITAFLATKGGYTPFTWTPPGKSEISVTVPDGWSRRMDDFGTHTIDCTFVRWYG
jgi:phage-related protein